jgi:hypothetical protein
MIPTLDLPIEYLTNVIDLACSSFSAALPAFLASIGSNPTLRVSRAANARSRASFVVMSPSRLLVLNAPRPISRDVAPPRM